MGLREQIRLRLINNLDESTYISIAKKYNDLLAIFKERNMRRSSTWKVIDCDLPLIYISQPPRCGGTITRNLLDGHPMFHVYPYELSWEKNGYHWEDNLRVTDRTFHLLKDKWISHAINHGFDKQIPFEFNRQDQRKIFLSSTAESSREVLGAYLTSFFNAWKNYQYFDKDKKYCVAFCPWTKIDRSSVEGFFNIYPDGVRLHIIRNPFAWWASEKSYDKRVQKNVDDYLQSHWIHSTKEGIHLSQKLKGKYYLLNYDQLVVDPQGSMKSLCEAFKIPFSEELVTPSLNSWKRSSNSSHDREISLVNTSSLDKWREILDDSEKSLIETKAEGLYREALTFCLN